MIGSLKREADITFLSGVLTSTDDYEVCKGFESFSGGTWTSDDTYSRKNFLYETDACSSESIYVDVWRSNGSTALPNTNSAHINLELHYFPDGTTNHQCYFNEAGSLGDKMCKYLSTTGLNIGYNQ
ncbi:hypothetical protein Dip510_000765 [Elusimicrobium posterum]